MRGARRQGGGGEFEGAWRKRERSRRRPSRKRENGGRMVTSPGWRSRKGPSPPIMSPARFSRRHFLQTSLAAALAAPASRLLAESPAPSVVKIALGMDNFSVRGLGW